MREPNISIILGKKLLAIRLWKKISQGKMLLLVILDEIEYNRARVSQWESGVREPPREALIRYSRLAGITLEVLLDDEQDLPAHIKKAGKSGNRGSRRKRHKKPFNMNITAGEETQVSAECKPLTLVAPTISSEIDIDNLEVVADNEIPGAEIRHYHPELMKLSLLTGEESKEPSTFELSSDTLDRVHDMHLRVQLQMPRSARSSLTMGGIVNLALNVVLFNYNGHGDESLIVKQARAMTKRLNE